MLAPSPARAPRRPAGVADRRLVRRAPGEPPAGPGPDDPDDADDLAVRFRTGQPTALRELFDRYGPAVAHLARTSLRNPADVDDVVQVTFVSAWNGRATYRPDRGSLLGWLLGIARRRIVDVARAGSRAVRDSDAVASAVSTDEATGADDAGTIVDRLLIADGMSHLSVPQQHVLTLSFYGGLTHVEIADRTGMALGTVKSHLRRGMESLRARLAEDVPHRSPVRGSEVDHGAPRPRAPRPAGPR